MRKTSLTLTLVSLLTGCVGTAPTESQAVTAPSSPCANNTNPLGAVALVLSAPTELVRGTASPITAIAIDINGTRTDATSMVTWSSSNFLSATAANGQVYGIGVGAVTIRASLGEVTGSADLNIIAATLQAISLTTETETAPAGAMVAWHANGHYNDGSTLDVSESAVWTSSDPSIATVDQSGQIHALASGMTMIAVSVGAQVASAPMMVTE